MKEMKKMKNRQEMTLLRRGEIMDEYSDFDMQRYDKEELVDEVTELYQENAEECGFVTKAEIEGRFKKGNVEFIHRNGRIVAALDYHHPKRKTATRVYHTAVDETFEGDGLRGRLVERVLKDSPFNRLITKVPVDVDENLFWREVGEVIGQESGRKRALNVYIVRGDESTAGASDVFRGW